MTYTETKEIMGAIEQIKTFSGAIQRERQNEVWDLDEIEKLEEYINAAAQVIFTMCNKRTTKGLVE